MTDDEMSRAISHDLRGPARRLAALLQMTKDKAGPLPEPAAEYLDLALDEVAVLQAQLEVLQEYSRVDRRVAAPQEVPLGVLITAQRADLGDRIVAEALPCVRYDPAHASRIIRALLDNVVQHAGEAAHLTIKVDEAVDAIRIHFHDDGEGVPAQREEHIFRLFNPVRGADGRTRLTSSLAIARRMARHHGGDLTLGPSGGGHFIWHIPKGVNP